MTSPFTITYLGHPFPDHLDPVIFPGEHFADGQHRLVISNSSGRQLHRTPDFETFTLLDADWMASEPPGGKNTFQDATVLPGGTFLLAQNDGDTGLTAVWTGSAADIDAGTITKVGRVLSTGSDCGVYYHDGLVHYFTEDPSHPFGSASSDRVLHFTTPVESLLAPTQLADALNTGGTWGTGDADVFEANGEFWMFVDYTTSHPTYWVALYRSADLLTWTLAELNFQSETGVRGGDFDVIDLGTHLIALSEYTTGPTGGVGVWRIDGIEPTPGETGSRRAATGGPLTRRANVGGVATAVTRRYAP